MCEVLDEAGAQPELVNCNGRAGRYVTVLLDAENPLTLCEVEVFSSESGSGGKTCPPARPPSCPPGARHPQDSSRPVVTVTPTQLLQVQHGTWHRLEPTRAMRERVRRRPSAKQQSCSSLQLRGRLQHGPCKSEPADPAAISAGERCRRGALPRWRHHPAATGLRTTKQAGTLQLGASAASSSSALAQVISRACGITPLP